MTSLFCRHNRMTAKCPICSKEMEAELRAKAPPRPPGVRRAPDAPRARRASTPRAGGVVTRRLARAADDGYRNQLVPGLRATADAERLAAALLLAAERIEPPGPYDAVATEPDREQATWLAFLLALAGPDDPDRQDAVVASAPRFEDGEVPEPLTDQARAVAAYRHWAERAGSARCTCWCESRCVGGRSITCRKSSTCRATSSRTALASSRFTTWYRGDHS